MEVIRHICRSPCQKIKTSPDGPREGEGEGGGLFAIPWQTDRQTEKQMDGRLGRRMPNSQQITSAQNTFLFPLPSLATKLLEPREYHK